MSLALGIDLGGTKAEIIAMDGEGREQLRHRVAHPKGSYDKSLSTLKDLVEYAEQRIGPARSLGIGHPGAISPKTGLLEGANATWLNHKPFGRDLENLLGRPIAFSNDANCLALSEAQDGAGADADIVLAVIIGTGCGGGIAVRKSVVNGANGMSGEICHLPLPWPDPDELPGPDCYCGKKGCLDAWLSGPALQADHATRTGTALSAPEIVKAAQGGDEAAEISMQRLESRLARALAMLIQTIDPGVIVLGGGLSNVSRLYDNLPALVRAFTAFEPLNTEIRPSVHGDSSGVRGAAWMGRDMARR